MWVNQVWRCITNFAAFFPLRLPSCSTILSFYQYCDCHPKLGCQLAGHNALHLFCTSWCTMLHLLLMMYIKACPCPGMKAFVSVTVVVLLLSSGDCTTALLATRPCCAILPVVAVKILLSWHSCNSTVAPQSSSICVSQLGFAALRMTSHMLVEHMPFWIPLFSTPNLLDCSGPLSATTSMIVLHDCACQRCLVATQIDSSLRLQL